ncbi:PilZ domain-containing protein [uncultured Sphingomonas sp.]|uniref:PilZ domain-containing protein n=1 Tax=uncultured Sphingomonas sp. TaxID=158754 RepID=UPI0025F34C29|nr:PilZ domain-containing protein [uncultured Sphingomonas sp.]
MSFSALVRDVPIQDDQRPNRYRTQIQASASPDQSPARPVIVHNISSHGLLVEAQGLLPADHPILFDIPGLGSRLAQVAWNSGSLYGCEFQQPLSEAAVRRKVRGERIVWGDFARDRQSAEPGHGTILAAPLPSAEPDLFSPTVGRDDDALWSGRARVAMIVGSSLSLWAMMGTLLYWLAT